MFMFSKQRKADKQAASKPNREGKKSQNPAILKGCGAKLFA